MIEFCGRFIKNKFKGFKIKVVCMFLILFWGDLFIINIYYFFCKFKIKVSDFIKIGFEI